MKIADHKITWTCIGLAASLLCGAPAVADDTEILLVAVDENTIPFNANILLIIDSSGSMDTLESTIRPYDSTVAYGGACDTTKLYWTELDTPPACDAANTQFIDKTAFVCKEAGRQLAGIGLYKDLLAQYRSGVLAGSDRWDELAPGDSTSIVECLEDSGFHGVNGDGSNPYALAGTSGVPYTDDPAQEVAWGSYPTSVDYTVYDGNYLNWRANPVTEDRMRIDIVKTAVKIALDSINSSNVGVMRFNDNAGGPVILGMTDLDGNRAMIDGVIDGILPAGSTPLSETMYEAALYWMGLPAYYGENINEHTTDPNALVSTAPEVYAAPKSPVCTKNYNVLLTDGLPVNDDEAPTLVPTLPNFATKLGRSACTFTTMGDCLDDITEYLSIPDLDTSQKGDQVVTTHTIGFTIDLPLLKSAAEISGGDYFLANDVESLTLALLSIFKIAADQGLAFSAPTVAVNTFNRTQNRNDLYMGVFGAKAKLHWPGNLKKYRIASQQIVDANNAPAVDPATGFFADTALSFWTQGDPDGPNIALGGAAHRLPDPASRNLYTNNGTEASLAAGSNAVSTGNIAAFTLADFGLTGASGEPTMDEVIRWARGEDLLDEDLDPATTVRYAMGDPLHAQPAAVEYGGVNPGDSDIVVYTATNDGYLHAINGATGEELWSFIPKDLLSNLAELYEDPDAQYKSYGLDGDVVPIVADRDNNGQINGTDFVYLVFGMRRGGNDYYALDVTDKNNPTLLWEASLPGFGQTWARPSIARVAIDDPALNADKAVVIVGGGYDPAHDTLQYPSSADSAGAGVYMLDLQTGAEIWRAGTDAGADLTLTTMTRAIPNDVRAIDLDANGFVDRLYAIDVGGQVWRFDLYPNEPPATAVTGGVIARLGAEGINNPKRTDTRRIYNSPDVAIFDDPIQGRKFISISAGTGYRAHPLEIDVVDRFYSLRDPDVFNRLTQTDYDNYSIATDSDFVEVSGSTQAVITKNDAGWMFTLPPDQAVLADSTTFNGEVFFIGFAPDTVATNECSVKVGRNFLYRVKIVNGDPVVNNLDALADADADNARMTELQQGGIAPAPQFLFPGPDDPNCTGSACSPPPIGCVGVECFDPGFVNRPVRTLWTQDGIE